MTGGPAVTAPDYATPARSGEVLIEPGPDRMPALLAAAGTAQW